MKSNETMNTVVSRTAEAILNLISNAVSAAPFDITIRAFIKAKPEGNEGKYRVLYEGAMFDAFAATADTKYAIGTEVYVLVPKNDFTQEKKIIGAVIH